MLEQEEERRIEQEEAAAEAGFQKYAFDPVFDEKYATSTSSARHSSHGSRPIFVHKQTQTNFSLAMHQPNLRNVKNLTEESKDAIATASYRAAISVPKVRVAVKAAVEKLCGL